MRNRSGEPRHPSDSELSQLLVESVVDYAIYALDPSGHVASWNVGAERIKGYEAAEIIGRHFSVFYLDPSEAEAELVAARERGRSESVGWRLRQDGRRIWVHSVLTRVTDAAGAIRGFAKVTRDLTASREAEIVRERDEARLLGIIGSAMDAIVSTDESQRIILFNKAAERIFGYPSDQIIGRPLDTLIPQRFRQGHQAQVHRFGDTGVTSRSMGHPGQLWGLRADGSEFPVEATISQLQTRGETVYTVILRDISERLRTEAALEESERRLQQSQKMEAVGRLAGGVAHDFNNMLTAIRGFAGLLRYTDDPEEAAECVSEIDRAAERAALLTRQLLAFSRQQVLQPRVLDLNAVVENMQRMLVRLLGAHLELEVRLAPDLWSVLADPTQVEQIVMNLAVNARDAMPAGGSLKFETQNVVLGDADLRVLHPEGTPGEYVLLAVSDTGHGMSEEVQSRIFEPFYTTKEQGSGSGLGLATVYGIVSQSGGFIQLRSEAQRGSTFQIFLPRARVEAEEGIAAPAVRHAPRGGTILLTEDEPAVRKLATQVLERAGYTVVVAADGAEALERSRSYPARIDLLLTDVIMPGISGPELARRIAPLLPGTRVLFMSGYTGETIAAQGLVDSGATLLEKPFTPDALVAAVEEMLRAG